MFSVAKQTFPAALLLAFQMHGAPRDARSCAGRGVAARFIVSVAHLPQTKRRREGKRRERDARSDDLSWRSSPRAALTDACWEAKWAKRSARMLPPPTPPQS